jgi:hypothetical protein
MAIMGGLGSPGYQLFKQLLQLGLEQLTRQKEGLLLHRGLLSDRAADLFSDE